MKQLPKRLTASTALLATAFALPARAQEPPAAAVPSPTPVPAEPPGASVPPLPSPEAAVATPPAAPAPTPAPAPVPPPALEQPRERKKGGVETKRVAERRFLGLAVGTPDTGAMPGRFRPSFGVQSKSPADYRFDFHGYMTVPLRFGVGKRENPASTQYETVLHGPPLEPDEHERFEHTGLVPEPWVQLGFSYGNSRTVANIIIAARSVSNASGFFDPPTQLGINDAFLTYKFAVEGFTLEADVGGFANRYGAMGEFDTGRYDTPIVARVGGVGETLRFAVPVAKELTFLAEHGVMGQFDRAPLSVDPAGWNSFTDPNVGTSFAHHAHLGLAFARRGQVALHYVGAFTRDDRTAATQADGSINVFGAEVNAQLAPFGRLFLAGAYTDADDARGVSGVIRVLNSFGGPGLMREYFGPNSNGTGTLTTLGGQYDLSIGEILRGPEFYSGYAPDVFVSAFGMFTHVTSKEDAFDGVDKVKYGLEATYSALSWLAGSARYDRVVSNVDHPERTFAAITPRLILRTDYNSQDQVTISYSHWFHGSGTVVRPQYAPCVPSLLGSSPADQCGDPSVEPDADTFSITASMWW